MNQSLESIRENNVDLLSTSQFYSKRIYHIQEHVLQLSRNEKYRDDHIRVYRNEIKNALGEVVEKITPDVTMEEYLRLSKEKFLVYEIFDYVEKSKKIQLVNLVMYYPESRLCFIYKAKNYYHVMLFGFYFEKIIRNIEKQELDHLFLDKTRTLEHEKLLQTQPYRVSNIMNPDGYVNFPENLENVFEEYVNRTGKPYYKTNLKFFRNYLWIHYQHMYVIEKKYIVEVYRDILMERKDLHDEMVDLIVSFL